MPTSVPPNEALAAFNAPTTRHFSRVEIYESDGITRWEKDTVTRLVGGQVTVDYDRDERRALDLTLSNTDQVLINAPGEFWYDKILKVYRGVRFTPRQRAPRMLIIDDDPPVYLPDSTYYNEVPDPLVTATTYYGASGGTLSLALGRLRFTRSADNSAYVFPKSASADNFVITPGQYVAARVHVFNPNVRAVLAILRIRPSNNGSASTAALITGTSALILPGESATLEASGIITPGSDANRASPQVWFTDSAGEQLGAGEPVDTEGWAFYKETGSPTGSPLPFFHGSSTDVDRYYNKIVHSWEGTPNASRSIRQSYTLDKDAAAPVGELRDALVKLGYGDVKVLPTVTTLDDLNDFEIIVSAGSYSNAQLLEDAYNAGKHILAIGYGLSAFGTDFWGVGAASSAAFTVSTSSPTVSPARIIHPVAKGWSSFTYDFLTASIAGVTVPDSSTITAPGWQAVSVNGTSVYISVLENGESKAVIYHLPSRADLFVKTEFLKFLTSAVSWLNPVEVIDSWETQVGEFMIDRISEPHFPHQITVTGRDYTKKCQSKFDQATQFSAGMSLESIIASIAGAAGIVKRALPVTNMTITRTFFFERGVTRWEAMKEIANAHNYEIFFDARGYLTIRPYIDPATSSPSVWVQTGSEGNLASYEKSTSDARIFNKVIVTGESSDTAVLPVYWIAENNDPTSPTAIQYIGERTHEYSSSFIETEAQAQELAESLLAIYAMEEYELNFEALVYPWLEVGDVLGFIDPRPAPDDPTTFLLSSITIPIKLGKMGGMGKRLTIVPGA